MAKIRANKVVSLTVVHPVVDLSQHLHRYQCQCKIGVRHLFYPGPVPVSVSIVSV